MANRNAVSILVRDKGFHRAAELLEALADARHFFEPAREIRLAIFATKTDEDLTGAKYLVAHS